MVETKIRLAVDGVQTVVGGLKQVGDKIGDVTTSIAGLTAIGGGLSIAAFASIVKDTTEAAGALHDLSIQTGATVESLSGLASVGKYSDVSIQQIATSMNKLANNMAGATEESRGAGKAIEALGINFDSFKRLSPDAQMRMVAVAMNQFEDGTGKAAVAMQLYGKEGARLLPFMKDLAETGDLHAKITAEQAAAADNFGDNLTKITSSGGAWKKELAVGIIPALNDLSEAWLANMNGAGGLRTQIRELSADGTIDDWARSAVNALTYVLDAGEGVARVFMMTGGWIAASVGQLVALSTGEIKQAARIGDAWLADMDKIMSKELLGQRLRDTFENTAKAKKQALTDYQQAVTTVMAAYAGSDVKIQQAAMAALRDSYFGAEKKQLDFTNITGKDKGNKDKLSDYEKLIRTINEKIAAEKMEAETSGSLTEGQKLALKAMVEIREGTIKLTEAEKIRVAGLLDQLLVEEQNADAKKREAKATLDAAEAHTKFIDGLSKGLDKLRDDVKAQQDLNDRIGLSKEAIAELDAIDLERHATILDGIAIKKLDRDLDEQQYDLYKRQAAALRDLADEKRLGATKQAMVDMFDESAKEAQKSFEDLSRSLTDNIMRGGKSAGEYLKDYFRTLVLRPVIQGVVNMGLNAVGMGGGSSGLMQGSSLINAGSTLYNGYTGLSSFGNTAAQVAQYGSTLAAGGTTAVSTGAAGTGWVSAEGGAGYLSEGAATFGETLATAAPYLAAAAAIYSIAKSLDDSGTIHTGAGASTNQWGTSSALDARALGFMQIDSSAETGKMVSGITSSIVNILNGTATTFGKQAGYSAATAFADDTSKDGAWGALLISKAGKDLVNWDANRQSRWAPREFADGQAGRDQYLAELSKSVRTALDDIGLPGWAQGMLDQLGDAPSITDLGAVVDKINATQTALVNMGNAIGGIKSLSDSAVTALINASGGVDALASAASGYFDGYYSEAEKLANTSKQVSDALAKVGLQMPATRDEFRDLVDANLALGEAGAPTVATLFKVAGAFGTVADAAEQAAQKAKQGALDNVQKAYTGLQKSVEEEKAKIAADHDKAMAQIQTRMDDVTKSVDKLRGLSDSLKSTIDRMRLPSQFASDRNAAQAQLTAALAIARAGGVLPDADSLRSALDIVSQPAEQLFASFVDYQRDFQLTKNNIGELSSVSDVQLSTQEQMLQSLQDQSTAMDAAYKAETERLDGLLSSAQKTIDVLNGIDSTGKTIAAALAGFNATVSGAITAGANGGGVNSTTFGGTGYGSAGGYGGASNGQGATDKLSAVESLYAKYSDLSYLTPSGGAFWADQFNKGIPLSQIEETFQDSVKAVRGFASGGDHMGGLRVVGENGMELEATGPSRIWNASQTRDFLSGGNNAELVAENRALREEVASMRKDMNAALYAIAKHAQKAGDALDDAANGARPIQTVAA